MNQPQDLYELLQVSPNAELDVIRAAYRRLATRYNPNRDDSLEAAEMVVRLNYAFEVLSDPDRRAEYDLGRSENISSRAASGGGNRTLIVIGALVFAVGCAISVSAFHIFTNSVTLKIQWLLERPLVLVGGLVGMLLGGAIALNGASGSQRKYQWIIQPIDKVLRTQRIYRWFISQPIYKRVVMSTLSVVMFWAVIAWSSGVVFDRNCSDFRSHRQAQSFYHLTGGPVLDPHRLEADGDGIACEEPIPSPRIPFPEFR